MTSDQPTPTLQDVATAAGVSTATVSRCLNFPDQVTKRTRAKVMQAVNALSYSPNFGARAMASRRTNTIGAIIPTMENAVFARGLQAFQDELHSYGFTMLVASTSYRADIEEEQIRALVGRGADALLLIGHERSPNTYRFLETQNVPTLITWAFDTSLTRPSIGFDNRKAMRDMALKVIELGHRNLAFISARTTLNDRAKARQSGIEDAMAISELRASDLHMVETVYGIEQGATAFEQVMKAASQTTAVFCGNDVLAVGALRRAREMGVRVPEDVSVIGFDDIELAEVAYPALTTVHVPHREMGWRAGKALAELVTNGTPIEAIELDANPVFRGTLAPAKG
ncbi:LacI family DNA-binding transcriptional regulator [Octadecabacter ascidiaceicola]|uniref:HTH-type transcriptional regulator GntR n=1 Tax=Octadecabacter ascidiaceicola TaxID=1655543 RepID=A0A238KMZ2_9RHOB|nr:LacI family DNA-binding transcriptional regulator [Octadecabacter ascidiaceicola]SMX44173.1 HTH-type transcriptional regulator GntR [Octadecabacter ascidiaceicola]